MKSKQRQAAQSQLGFWDPDKPPSRVYLQLSALISPGSTAKALLYSATPLPSREAQTETQKGVGSEILPNLSSAHKIGQRTQGGVETRYVNVSPAAELKPLAR